MTELPQAGGHATPDQLDLRRRVLHHVGDLGEALARAYAGVSAVRFEDAQFRTDIGGRASREEAQ